MAKRRIKQINCPNCDYLFNGIDNYCPNCGQENHTHRLPVKHFVIEAIEGYFHFDTKLLNTIKDLIFRPGLITKNYNMGKRARYVSPVRFYIFVSFVFFLILSFQNPVKENDSKKEGKSAGYTFTVASLDKEERIKDYKRLASLKELDNFTIDHYLDSVGVNTAWYNKSFLRNYVKFETGHITQEELRYKMRKNISVLMFLLMPLVAFYLYVLHLRKRLYYSEHLIFSIHFHSMMFLVLSIWLLCKSFLSDIWLFAVFLPFILIHSVWSMKVLYQQKFGVLVLKIILLGSFYTISIFVFFIILILSSLL